MSRDAEEIVRLLADANPPFDGRFDGCCFCNADMYNSKGDTPGEHAEDCPWRLAREWVADQ